MKVFSKEVTFSYGLAGRREFVPEVDAEWFPHARFGFCWWLWIPFIRFRPRFFELTFSWLCFWWTVYIHPWFPPLQANKSYTGVGKNDVAQG